jgi:cobalt-zinc-cadmium efflux system membrane fusion protein
VTLSLRLTWLGVAILASLCGLSCSPAGHPNVSSAKPAPAEVVSARVAQTTGQALCAHGVPAELCTKCNPDLIEVFKAQGDWCAGHGLPESQCKQCNPGLDFTKPAAATPSATFCKEHGVPEAMCTKCKPSLVAKFIEAGDYCREHGLPESVCPICHPEVAKAAGMAAPTFPPEGTEVRLVRPELAEKAGIATQRAEIRPYADAIEVVGQIEFNENRLAQLSSRGDALVDEVKVDVGDEVRAKQPLVVLTSANVGDAQGRRSAAQIRLDMARAALTREESLLQRGISAKREVDEARANLATAEGELAGASAGLSG